MKQTQHSNKALPGLYDLSYYPAVLKRYEALPDEVRALAVKNYELLKSNAAHPSLQFKRLTGKRVVWAVRVGEHYRALGREREDTTVVWFWIGTHEEYNQLIKRL